jgi:hypothetical protein
VEIVWRQHTLRRCEQAKIEAEMRPAARALLRELLDDGQRSAQELDSLVVRCTHLALSGDLSGLDEVRKLAPSSTSKGSKPRRSVGALRRPKPWPKCKHCSKPKKTKPLPIFSTR